MRRRQFNKISISVSLMVVVLAAFWVWSAWHAARDKLDATANDRIGRVEAMYRAKVEQFGQFAIKLAAVIGNETDVNQLFYEASLAAGRDGGRVDGPEVARLRAEILNKVMPAWQAIGGDEGIEAVQFHLPPATALLRLPRSDRYGDDLSKIRTTLVVANRELKPVSGIEAGISGGGVRGVVPIFHETPDGQRIHVGSVEAGMSVTSIVSHLPAETGAEFAILVSESLMRDSFLPEVYDQWVERAPAYGNLRLMAGTSPETGGALLEQVGIANLASGNIPAIFEVGTSHLAVTRIALRDFRAELNPARPDVGAVLAWVPLDDAVLAYKREVAKAVVIALFVVFFLEAMLFFALSQEQKLALQRKASVTDALTGVSNRRHFDEVLDAEVRRAARSGQPVSIILADVDYFKRYNDHYGHQTGDECLRRVAAAMSGELRRAGDFIARYGGEEFVVVLPDSSLSAGLTVAEKLRRAVAALNIPHEKHPGGQKVTISMGVAAGRVSQNDAKALVAMSDEALYRAKGAGRNNSQGLRFGDDSDTGQALPLLYR